MPSISFDSTSSTSFPYTTLFRSRAQRVQRAGPGRRRLLRVRRGRAEGGRDRPPPAHGRVRPDHHHLRAGGRAADRKSTRLNSSHLVISYAVFCLRKKTINLNSKL